MSRRKQPKDKPVTRIQEAHDRAFPSGATEQPRPEQTVALPIRRLLGFTGDSYTVSADTATPIQIACSALQTAAHELLALSDGIARDDQSAALYALSCRLGATADIVSQMGGAS